MTSNFKHFSNFRLVILQKSDNANTIPKPPIPERRAAATFQHPLSPWPPTRTLTPMMTMMVLEQVWLRKVGNRLLQLSKKVKPKFYKNGSWTTLNTLTWKKMTKPFWLKEQAWPRNRSPDGLQITENANTKKSPRQLRKRTRIIVSAPIY